ncbi:class II glutamine amidotransferase [Mycobacterium sp. 050272]|uniref:class II glutamine amidotransferase n=1 Tax=Mycobacterium sp. 050272 TaxID=3142488 RepID=UPI0031977695
MCRLFGLHAGTHACTATFWLLDAPDSLSEQSRRNPDGTGLGVFESNGEPRLYKEPIAAWQDRDFATEAHSLTGTTFIAHVRYATTGSLDVRNTHPFLQDGRIFAHNGVLEGLEILDERLREVGAQDFVLGQTDSERVFALITASIRAAGGDVCAGIAEAMTWLADNVPIYAVNVLLCTATDMWAMRYPATHQLCLLDRRHEFAATADSQFDLRTMRIHAQSDLLCTRPSVVLATEPMDSDPRWRLLQPGELLHVDGSLQIHRTMILPDPPKHLLRREDLSVPVEVAQHALPNTRKL